MNTHQERDLKQLGKHWIDGEWIGSSTVANSVSPSTGEVLGQYSAGGRVEAASAIAAARKAFNAGVWSHDPQLHHGRFSNLLTDLMSERMRLR